MKYEGKWRDEDERRDYRRENPPARRAGTFPLASHPPANPTATAARCQQVHPDFGRCTRGPHTDIRHDWEGY